MSRYKFDLIIHDFSKLSRVDRNKLLKPFHQNKKKFVHCLCTSGDGVPMVTALVDGNYYIRAFPSKSNKGVHARSCPHFIPDKHDFAMRGYNEEALKINEEGIYTFSLSTPLRKSEKKTIPIHAQPIHILRGGASVKTSNTITLLGLFNFIWEQAELNSSRTVYEDINIWSAMRDVAWRIQPKNMRNLTCGMSDFLVLPTTECSGSAHNNNAKLYYALQNKRHILFAVSLTGEEIIEYGINNSNNENGFSLKNHFGVQIKLARADSTGVLSKFNQSFGHEITYVTTNEDIRLILLGMADVKEYKTNKYAEIQTLSAMAVSHSCIPLDSMYEKEFTDFLIQEGRKFIKPMRYDQTSELKLLPDFILHDTSPICLIEVYGMNNPDYLNRKAQKKKIYEEIENTRLSSWNWDVIQANNLSVWVQNHPLPRISK